MHSHTPAFTAAFKEDGSTQISSFLSSSLIVSGIFFLRLQQVAAALDEATARSMHTIFEGGAAWTDQPERTRREALRLAIGRMLNMIVDR